MRGACPADAANCTRLSSDVRKCIDDVTAIVEPYSAPILIRSERSKKGRLAAYKLS